MPVRPSSQRSPGSRQRTAGSQQVVQANGRGGQSQQHLQTVLLEGQPVWARSSITGGGGEQAAIGGSEGT